MADSAAPLVTPLAGPLVLYDGDCGVCDRFVQFVLARDPAARVRFAPLGGETAAKVLARAPDLALADSIVLVDLDQFGTARIFARSDAVLRILLRLSGPWRAARVLWVVPRPLRDTAYNIFARWRHGLSRSKRACSVPRAVDRGRFLP